MKIILDIVPPKSTGQSGKRLGNIHGRAMMFETKESKETKKMLYSLLYDKKPKDPFSGAIIVRFIYFFPYNSTVKKSIQKKGLIIPKTTKPDWDNIPKQIQDVMTKLQFWTDDALIFSGGCEKYFAPKGRIVIEIIPVPSEIQDFKQMFVDMGYWED